MDKLITIIIRAYNAERYIDKAITSILNNTYDGPIEIIVCYDTGSKDHTLEHVEQLISNRIYDKNRTIKLIKHEHMTPFQALVNCGFSNASGMYISILDYDNLYPHKHIEKMVEVANKTGKDFLFVRDYFFDDRTFKIIGISQIPKNPCDVIKVIQGNYIDGNAMFIGKRCLSLINEKLKRLNHRLYDFLFEDWLIALIGLKYCKCLYTDESYVLYRIHGANLTGVNVEDFRTNILTAMRNISTLIAFYELENEKLSKKEIQALEISLIKSLFVITSFFGEGVAEFPLFRTSSKIIHLIKKLKTAW